MLIHIWLYIYMVIYIVYEGRTIKAVCICIDVCVYVHWRSWNTVTTFSLKDTWFQIPDKCISKHWKYPKWIWRYKWFSQQHMGVQPTQKQCYHNQHTHNKKRHALSDDTCWSINIWESVWYTQYTKPMSGWTPKWCPRCLEIAGSGHCLPRMLWFGFPQKSPFYDMQPVGITQWINNEVYLGLKMGDTGYP